MSLRCLLLLIMAWVTLPAVEAAAEGSTPSGRLHLSYEVEVVQVTPGDAAALAQWAELAALGYRVVAAVPQASGGAALYLERMAPHGAHLALPKAIDAGAADAVRRRIRERLVEPSPAPRR